MSNSEMGGLNASLRSCGCKTYCCQWFALWDRKWALELDGGFRPPPRFRCCHRPNTSSPLPLSEMQRRRHLKKKWVTEATVADRGRPPVLLTIGLPTIKINPLPWEVDHSISAVIF